MAKLAQLPVEQRALEHNKIHIPRIRTRYYAFLSYSHKDRSLADWLHRELERFRVPAQNQAATRFNFTLQDTSGANVKFASLDTCDNIDTCPPTGSGNHASQITGISMHNNSNNNQPNTAAFTDKNNNPATNGEMNVSYQWNFTCGPRFTVLPFDPIIKNGGNTGPIT